MAKKKPNGIKFRYLDYNKEILPTCVAEKKARSWNCKYFRRLKDCNTVECVFCDRNGFCVCANAIMEEVGGVGVKYDAVKITKQVMAELILMVSTNLKNLIMRAEKVVIENKPESVDGGSCDEK